MLHHDLINAFQERWAETHPLIKYPLALAATAGLGILALPGSRTFYHSWKQERALHSAAKADQEQRLEAARDFSITAIQSGDTRIEAFRILEKAMAGLQDSRHLEVAGSLLEHPQATPADRSRAFRGLCLVMPLATLGQLWAQRPEEQQLSAEMAAPFARRLLDESKIDEAASVLFRIPAEKQTEEIRLLMARTMIRSGKTHPLREVQRWIAAIAKSAASPPREWLDLLCEIPPASLSAEGFGPVIAALAKQFPNLTGEDAARIALLQTRFQYAAAAPARRPAIAKGAALRWKTDAPLALNLFLRQLGMHKLRAESLAAIPARQEPQRFLPLLEALLLTEQFEPALQLVRECQDLTDPVSYHAYLAHIHLRLNDVPRHRETWNKALQDAKISPEPDRLIRLARLCESIGALQLAEEAWTEAAIRGAGPLPLYRDFAPICHSLAAKGREATLLSVLSAYLTLEPTNIVLLTQYGYLACLNDMITGENLLEAMRPMADQFPNEAPIQFTLATALLSVQRPAEAAEILAPLAAEPLAHPPGFRAILLATQSLTGLIPPNSPAITSLPRNELLPSERRKFDAWLLQSKQSTTPRTPRPPTETPANPPENEKNTAEQPKNR